MITDSDRRVAARMADEYHLADVQNQIAEIIAEEMYAERDVAEKLLIIAKKYRDYCKGLDVGFLDDIIKQAEEIQ